MTAAEIYKEVIADLRLVIKIQSDLIQDLLVDRQNYLEFREKKTGE
jgi:hypothetical protein